MPALEELDAGFRAALADGEFQAQLNELLKSYVGRPTPIYEASHFAQRIGSGPVWLKREDLAHTGAHKINNAVGQGLLAQRMGKRRIIAETGAGQHGVASATVCAMLGLDCVVYMGEEDMRRQAVNVYRMRLLGAEVRPVTAGTRTLKDAISEAFRDWVTNIDSTYYLLGSVVGPSPYPEIGRTFQAVISREARAQSLDAIGRLPDRVVACVGGGSNAIGSVAVEDGAALDAFFALTRTEGIMPALEPAHALAWVQANPHPGVTLVTLSGRGDKDIQTVATASGHEEYLA